MQSTEEKDDLLHARTPGQVMALGLAAVTMSFVVAVVWFSFDAEAPTHGVNVLANLLGMIAVPLLYLVSHRLAIAPSLRLQSVGPAQGLWIVGMMVAALPAVLALGGWNQSLVPPPPEYFERLERVMPSSGPGWVATIFSVVVVTPIAEEIVFRGMIQQAARRALGPIAAVIFTAIVFSIWHVQLWNVASLALLGLFFGLAFEATGSLVASIVAHAAYNLFILLIYNYGREVPDFGDMAAGSSVEETIVLVFAPVVALAVAWAAYGRLRLVTPWPEIEAEDETRGI